MSKEQNFISAVIYLQKSEQKDLPFVQMIVKELEEHFMHFEIVTIVQPGSESFVEKMRSLLQGTGTMISVLHMAPNQSKEMCMNAGIDAAIGDYVFEFEKTDLQFPAEYIFRAYEKSQEGFDIVSLSPDRQTLVSKCFYSLFNTNAPASENLRTEAFRLSSRRAINRVHATSPYLPYRKAAFAASGLSSATLFYHGSASSRNSDGIKLAMDSLLLYTAVGYRSAVVVSLAMLVLAICAMLYAVVVFFAGSPIEGWTTTVLIVTWSFSGLFLILTIVVKYLDLLLQELSNREHYLVARIEKL